MASSASACSPISTPASREHGPSFYRHLFWETGFVGQVLYLKLRPPARARRASGVSTTIRCTTCLGSQGHAFQSLYHFTVGDAGRGCAADDRARICLGV